MIEKTDSRRIRSEIRSVLLQVWNPIGIKDEPKAQDECNGYVGHVFPLLTENKSDEVIAGYLVRVLTERMGLKAKTSDMAVTVQALRRIALPDQSLT
jgi:hypothetical protein